MTPHAYSIDSRYNDDEPPSLAGGDRRPGFGPGHIFKRQGRSETIKVGVLHSLSGTMAISETTLKDTVLFLIDEQNKKGGVLGKKLEAVVVDPHRTGRCLRKRHAS